MIFKSFEVENNINIISKFKCILIYGENIGLKEGIKKKFINSNKDAELINFYEEDFLKNKDILTHETQNISLFTKEKLIIINQANEKILTEIESLLNNSSQVKILLISEILDKKSKLRSFFEKTKNLAVIACYNDTEITLKNLVQKELNNFQNINKDTVDMIIKYSNLNRKTILTNLEKIKNYFNKKILDYNSLESLLNSDRNEIFENIRDAALEGEKNRLNELMSNFNFTPEDTYIYLNMLNFRLSKLLDIHRQNLGENIDQTIDKMKPPIFWKDKPIYRKLIKKWDKQRTIEGLTYVGKIEREIKSKSNLNALTIVKNSITNICSNSWNIF